ncbi:MAG: WD40 repeat domain-containing protein [Gemmatimonadota bacterium]
MLRGPTDSVHGVTVSSDGLWVAGAGFDNQVWLWPYPSGQPPIRLTGHRRKVSGVSFHPNSFWLASAASDSTVRFWQFRR